MLHHHRITRRELFQAQLALVVAIGLQLVTNRLGSELLPGSQYLIIFTEIALAIVIGFTANLQRPSARGFHHAIAVILLGLITAANISGLIFVLHYLIVTHATIEGTTLLASALAIFLTNIIVFALWYWEIDSPGLTRTRWSKHDKDFQFTQQDISRDLPDWQPQFVDYFYLSVTNAINFAPAGDRPITHQAKLLMSSQALVSVFTLALLITRGVSILGP
jgi:hypothetical protein